MKIGKLNLFLLVVFVASILGNWFIGRDYQQPNWEFMPEMVHSVPYDTYTPNPNFADGMTQQKPVANTIPRGLLPLHYKATPEDAERAGKELQNPYVFLSYQSRVGSAFFLTSYSPVASLALLPKFTLENLATVSGQKLAGLSITESDQQTVFLERGALVWTNYCQVCHGASGKGDGPVTLRGVPPPPSLLAEKAIKMKDGQMFHVLTYGQGNMGSYAAQLSRKDRWLTIMHIRALQKNAANTGGEK